ncbi:neurotensin/neuromedin N [Hippoglossus hippoglossus]|uniref:neurotensin/neuromedin N n=1 Tax=Hippoglossus hippoglossus TaxID=8267 RepID=UPI00148C7F6B|nr:neurotensin/neuromedin N [Hippoglossus hippoglossus]XP_035013373.1 neurotensin/neuromedin N [Hippoglossus stenolepis]
MQAQLACMLLLFFTCGGLCTDVDQEQRALEEELLSSLFTSKMRQNKQSAPYWRMSLSNLCRMVSSLRQETWSAEEREEGELRGESLQMLEELYSLQHICRALQSREERLLHDSLEYLEENSDTPLKRKSPYILKRQATHTTKSRRPYILKRSTVY